VIAIGLGIRNILRSKALRIGLLCGIVGVLPDLFDHPIHMLTDFTIKWSEYWGGLAQPDRWAHPLIVIGSSVIFIAYVAYVGRLLHARILRWKR